jgi:hypothetical protein
MTLDEAKQIVREIDDFFRLYDSVAYDSEPRACLDGHFTAQDLEALAMCMRAGVPDEEFGGGA